MESKEPDNEERGRNAEDSAKIPAKGWRDILLRMKDQMAANHLSITAAGIAYFAFLAIFPGLAALFSLYASNFGNFNETYGSVGAVVVLMMWFYISAFIVLLGGTLNAEMEHQTAVDSTRGTPKPRGKRDAHMADDVGEKK